MKYTSTEIQVKLETAVLTACRQSLPLDNLEVDAIICVNVADRREEHVVKIHQRFDMCGATSKNFIKVEEPLLNDMVVDIANDKGVEAVLVGEQNVRTVQTLFNNQNLQSDSIEKTKSSNKSVTGSGRSPSRHPRKSSTPRCLNPKLRQINLNNMFGTVPEKDEDFLNDLSTSKFGLDNVYSVIDYDKENLNEISCAENRKTVTKNCSNDEMAGEKKENKCIKIEPNTVHGVLTEKDILPKEENDCSVPEERKSVSGDNSIDNLNSADNDFIIEVNSDSESYDTTYNYTFDKTDENVEENTQVIMKSMDDSDDQSLGSSPSDLTNSMMSYNVSHIIPAGVISEHSDILDIPNYPPPQLFVNGSRGGKPKGGGKWNDLASSKCTDIPSSVEKLSCRVCGAMFSSTRTRRRHETSTCGATRFSCIVCSRLFSRKDARRRHMMRMHPLYLLENSQVSGKSVESLKA